MIEQFFDEFKRKYQELNKTSTIFAAITLPISLMVLMLIVLSYNLMVALVPFIITAILFIIIIFFRKLNKCRKWFERQLMRWSFFEVFASIMTLSIVVSYVWFLIKGTLVDNKSGVLDIALVLMIANIVLTILNFAMRSLPSKTYPNAKVYKSCFIAVVVGVLLILVLVACLFELNNDKSNYINRSADELSAPSPTQLTEESAPIGTVQDADNEAAPTATPSPAQSNNVKESKQNLLFGLVAVLIVVNLAYWLVDRIVEKPVIKSSDIVNMTKELLSEHEMLDEKSIDMLCEFCKTSIEDRVFGDKKERVLLLIAILGVTAEGMFEKWAGSLVDNHRIVLDITVMAVVLLAYTAWVYVKIRGIHAKEKLKLEREMLFALKTIKCNLKGSAFE